MVGTLLKIEIECQLGRLLTILEKDRKLAGPTAAPE